MLILIFSNKRYLNYLQEFTCDVSVEGGKASQPLQFSFTFYDLDGHHHGKITKDVSSLRFKMVSAN